MAESIFKNDLNAITKKAIEKKRLEHLECVQRAATDIERAMRVQATNGLFHYFRVFDSDRESLCRDLVEYFNNTYKGAFKCEAIENDDTGNYTFRISWE